MTARSGLRATGTPVVVAAVVAMLVLGMSAVVSGGRTGVGPGPDRQSRPAVTAPPTRAFQRNLTLGTARLTGYSARGTRLTLRYTMEYPDCLVAVVHPAVSESSTSVSVQLQRVKIAAQRLPTCPTEPVAQVVSIGLHRPLAGRDVTDRADDQRILPRVSP